MTNTMRTTLRICEKHGIPDSLYHYLQARCPICGEYCMFFNGEPFCGKCESQYVHANVLGEGPNESVLPRSIWTGLAYALALEAAVALLVILWRLL